MDKRRLRAWACALAVAGVVAVPAGMPAAWAVPIRFDNPAGPEHYVWAAEGPPTTHYVVITLPPELQQDLRVLGVPGAFYHPCMPADDSSLVVSAPGSYVQKGGVHSATLAAFELNELIPSADATHFWGSSGYVAHPSIGSNYLEGEELYAGVEFDPGDGLHYGWIGAVRTGLELDAFAWGYETDPGVSIPAGAPEPGTLALLTLGALLGVPRRA